MLAKLADALPPDDSFLFEPKWDGFRAIVFRGESDLFIQSRDLRPFDRYFPELHDALLEKLPKNCVIDGEIVIADAGVESCPDPLQRIEDDRLELGEDLGVGPKQ